jgi:cell division transport system permease protein
MFIISNTIQLVIQSRKQEIEIMRMMGVNNWYIKAPYILQGAFYGFAGAVLSIIPLNILQYYLDKAHRFFNIPIPIMATNLVILCLLIMGITFGAGGSVISVKKYLKV